MWVLSFAAPANYLLKRQVMSRFAVNHIKQLLTTCWSRPIAVQMFLLSKQTFLHINQVIIGCHYNSRSRTVTGDWYMTINKVQTKSFEQSVGNKDSNSREENLKISINFSRLSIIRNRTGNITVSSNILQHIINRTGNIMVSSNILQHIIKRK
jgi:hypothetical protein